MDNGLLIAIIAVIIFSVMLIISINNSIKEKREKEFINILNTQTDNKQTNTLLIELLKTEKSSNMKLNIIMWIMLIPIIINVILLFITISAINEIILKITSLL